MIPTSEWTKNWEFSTHLVRPVTIEPLYREMQQTDRLLGKEDHQGKVRINDTTHETMQIGVSELRPNI